MIDTHQPVDVTDPVPIKEDWAECPDPATIDFGPRIATAAFPYRVVNGRPVNPFERTGRVGNAVGLWGENRTGDGKLRFNDKLLLIRRGDGRGWAMPGGFADPGEEPMDTIVREVLEETGVHLDPARVRLFPPRYVPDDRGSDEAWIVTTVGEYRFTEEAAAQGLDDADDAGWFHFPGDDVDQLDALLRELTGVGLFLAHRTLLRLTRNP